MARTGSGKKESGTFSLDDLAALSREASGLLTRSALRATAELSRKRHPLFVLLSKLDAKSLSRRDVRAAVEETLASVSRFLGEKEPFARLAAIVSTWPDRWKGRFLEAVEKSASREASAAVAIAREAARGAPLALEVLLALLGESDWPDEAWAKRVRKAVGAVGPREIDAMAARLLALDAHQSGTLAAALVERVIWTAGLLARSGETLRSLAATAERDARRGSSHAPLAQAVVRALAVAPAELALPELERLSVRVKHRPVLKAIVKAQEAHAARAGATREALAERSVPSFGLDARGERVFPDGTRLSLDARGRAVVSKGAKEGKETALSRENKRGKKAALSGEVKRITKSIDETLSVQRALLENAMVDERAWTLEAFRESFAHPILGHLARRVLWLVRSPASERALPAFFTGSRLEGLSGKTIEPASGATLSLAHPVVLQQDELEAARTRLVALGLVQPWKQLFREVYAVAPHEQVALRTERFRAHVVPHHALYALAKGRGWTGFQCLYDRGWEGKRTFAQGFRAHLDVGEATGSDHDPFSPGRKIRLGDLCFEEKDGRSWAQVSLGGVPPVVFSEACRDLDLVVGVASIGEDSAWLAWDAARRRGEASPFPEETAESARTEGVLAASADARAALVARVLPALGLGERVKVAGRFAHVRGELATYRVHLGSANVHRESTGKFVVFPRPARELAPAVYLPDDAGSDPRTAEVVARILLLAGDALVSDPDLAAQLSEA